MPGFAALEALFDRHLGEEAAASLRAPFVLGDRATLAAMFAAAGIPDARVETSHGTARFPSIEAWVRTEVKGWTLADQVDEDGYRRLQRAARDELRDFAGLDGAVAFAVTANLVVAGSPADGLVPRSLGSLPGRGAGSAGRTRTTMPSAATTCTRSPAAGGGPRPRAAPATAPRRPSPGLRGR